MTVGPMPREIAQRAQELKIAHLALMMSLPAIMHPDLPLLRHLNAISGESPLKDHPLILYNGEERTPDREGLSFSALEIFTKATKLRGDVLGRDLLSISMLHSATRIGDMIVAGQHSRQDVPLLQFARHYRNACAHGDRWDFRPDEPRSEATCRDVTLTSALHGTRATYNTIGPRLHVEFLDDISNYFLPGSVPAPSREAP